VSWNASLCYFDCFLNAWFHQHPNAQVFQRRIDGSTDFYLDWMRYEEGFGDKFGEYWIGECVLLL